MKMKKKLTKKLNILNRNIHINYYNNYLIYSYLNNYNLKLYFYYLKKKCNNLNTIYNITKLYKFLNYKYFFLLNNLYIKKNFSFFFNLKNKYFFNKQNEKYITIFNNKLLISTNQSDYYFYLLNENKYFCKLEPLESNNKLFNFLGLIWVIFFLNMIKIYDNYKNIINLTLLNI